jgi:hypothetical protein
MVESIVLIEGRSIKKESLTISLSNAKQIVIGSTPGFGIILHVAANSSTDLGNALIAFSKIPDVTGVLTLALRS